MSEILNPNLWKQTTIRVWWHFFVREAFLDKNSRTNSRTKYALLGQILGQNRELWKNIQIMYKALYNPSLWRFLRRKWESESVFKRKFSDKYLKKFYIKINKKKTYRGFFGDGHFRTNVNWFVRSFVFRLLFLEPTRAIFGFDFFLRIVPTRAIIKTNQKETRTDYDARTFTIQGACLLALKFCSHFTSGDCIWTDTWLWQ